MPSFLEGVFCFGFNEHGQDCTMTSFQGRSCFSDQHRALQAQQLGRSGSLMEQCYGLRSVERSNNQADWPWSVRLCSTYHSLDMESAQATWIVVKANRLVEKLVRDSMASTDVCININERSVVNSLTAALHIHGLIAIWSTSNWQRYIKFLEDMLQDITRPTLSVTMGDRSTTVPSDQYSDFCPVASPTQMSFEPDQIDEKRTFLRRTGTSLRKLSTHLRTLGRRKSSTMPTKGKNTLTVTQHQLSFTDLPRVHYIEEKANEALDALCNNEEVLGELESHYAEVFVLLKARSNATVEAQSEFVNLINRTQKDLRTQQQRLRQLLRLHGDRKALV